MLQNFRDRAEWILYLFFTFGISRLPFRLLFLGSDACAWFLRRVVRYRRDVLRNNLRNSFPGISSLELTRLEKASYLNLCDVLFETLKMPALSPTQLKHRFRFADCAAFETCCQQRQSLVILSAHIGNWEWGALATPPHVKPLDAVGFYKPIKNRLIDAWEKKSRSRNGLTVVSMFKTTKTFNIRRKMPTAFFLLADQSPSDRKTARWTTFLHQPTAWLHGPEKHSSRLNYPVFLFVPLRQSRGNYKVEITLLAMNPSSLPPGELTTRYAQSLEYFIQKHPEQWLWTHRRWKMKPD